MDEIFLPVLLSFANDNVFTGSSGPLRFKATPKLEKTPSREVDMENSGIFVEYWHGPFCYEKSEIEGSETFPLSEEGISQIRIWLAEKR